MSSVADAYEQGASAWAEGPTRVYARLAELLVAFSPSRLDGCLVLDLGSGTGAGSRAARAGGARVIASDIAHAMLLLDHANRPPSAVADACHLPFSDRSFDAVVAPFTLNHLDDPASGIREAGRVGSLVLGSTYAVDDDHPVKATADQALREAGWTVPDWYSTVKNAMQSWGTVELATSAIQRGGLRPVRVEHIDVAFNDLTPAHLVAWRFGMAHAAPFLASLDDGTRARATTRALELLGPDPEPLVRKVIFLAAR